MKKSLILFALLLILATAIGGCTKIDQGYEGAKINTLGSDKGEIDTLGQGWQVYNIFKYDIVTNPLFTQDYVYTADRREGSPNDESITFQSSETLPFRADVGISFTLIPGQSGNLYKNYHKTLKDMVDSNLRNTLRDAFNREASKRTAEEIYGKDKVEFITAVQDNMQEYWKGLLNIKRVYLIGKLEPPKEVTDAINKKIQAKQKAETRENEVAESKAIALKQIEATRGATESSKMQTDAAAYEITQKANAQAQAIEMVGKALDKYKSYSGFYAIGRWNGAVPLIVGSSSGQILNISDLMNHTPVGRGEKVLKDLIK